MTDGLNLVAKDLTVRNPEAIELCCHTNAHVPVIDIIETANRIDHLPLFHLIP